MSFPYRTTDAYGRDDDVPHLALIDEAIAKLQAARKLLDAYRPDFAKADGLIEEADRAVAALVELPCVA